MKHPPLLRTLLGSALAAGLLLTAPCFADHAKHAEHAQSVPPALQAAVDGAWRDPANRKRDIYRHPAQTLAFFGVKATDTVVEITPGTGWYSEILAPYLQARGQYVAAVVDPQSVPAGGPRDYQQKNRDDLQRKFDADPAHYAKARIVGYDPAAPVLGPAGSADVVLTFRNVHNWRMAGQAAGMFQAFFAVLKPGGTLGVVEHRAKADVADDDKSGYVGQRQVIALAEAAGFRLAARSEINANPKDSKDYPGGVWTLPPTNKHDPADDAKYQAIGESDRMTLKFVKP
ncbi:MAG: methyltransferase [Pseudoxanthomonas sp.]